MKKRKEKAEIKSASKRRFLKNCTLGVIATAAYKVISIMAPTDKSWAKTCEGRCEDFCVECTGCTTAPCFEVPEPGPPIPDPQPETRTRGHRLIN